MTEQLRIIGLSATFLATTLVGGCYSGAKDAIPEETTERYGKSCYYAYTSSRSASYTQSSSGKNEAADAGFKLTVEATPVSGENFDERALNEIRRQAAQLAGHHIQQACLESEEAAYECSKTCDTQGLHWLEQEDEDCDECIVRSDGTIDCGKPSDALQEALHRRWYGDRPWVFEDKDAERTIVVLPPKLTENHWGELVWESDVSSHGFCSCACGY